MRKTILAFLVLCVGILSAEAQRRATTPLIIKGVEARTPQLSGPKPPPPPPALSAAAKQQLLKSLNLTGPGSLYVKLTPRNTYAASKGSLWFNNATFVDGGLEWAAWYPAVEDGTRYVRINLKSEGAGHKYLFDCTVGAGQLDANKGPFKLWRTEKMIQTFDADEQHLVFLLDAAGNGWNEFQISGGPQWYFFSCEVTRL